MNLIFPSSEFDDAVAAVCHGSASDEQLRALNELLRTQVTARDEYLLRVELHARLASDPHLFSAAAAEETDAVLLGAHPPGALNIVPLPPRASHRRRMAAWAIGLTACFLILATLALFRARHPSLLRPTSIAVAVLSHAVEARWNSDADSRAVGAALDPGWLRLKSGLIQVTFYSGARLVIAGPAQVRLVSAGEAFCQAGRVIASVPPQARGFRVDAPQLKVADLGTEFGLDVKRAGAEVHVFKGEVEYQVKATPKHRLKEGEAAEVDSGGTARPIFADRAVFASLLDLESKWLAMLALRYDGWRAASALRNQDPSLLARFDFEGIGAAGETLRNVAAGADRVADAAIVGCQGTEGRWPGKRALEFRGMSDRVRFDVPGEYGALTLSVWVNVKGLDRQFNSLCMCDGFDAGKIHWQIRNDGVLDLGVQGPRKRDVQICASPAVVGFNQFGQWLHLAVVVDGERRLVVHYANGSEVSQHVLRHAPPYRLGPAELGNWNPGEFPHRPPFLIRHFSGAMDEFALFNRALSSAEILEMYAEGKPQPDP